MLPNLLPRILILLRIAVKNTAIKIRPLRLTGITRATGDIRRESTLGLRARGHGVASARHHLAGHADVAGRAWQVSGVVGGHGGRWFRDAFVVEVLVLGALVGAWHGGDRAHFACVVGDCGSCWRHFGEAAALVRVWLLADHFGGC